MDALIQTGICSIVYGDFNGKPNQELFRCPRELDGTDLVRYINENRTLVGFEDDGTEELRKVPGKKLIGYWRMYWRDGWYGTWLSESEEEPSKLDLVGVDNIINWFCEKFQKGCSYTMIESFENNFTVHGHHRYLIRPKYSSIYKVMVDTEYGNGDYPVRIYVYHDEEEL